MKLKKERIEEKKGDFSSKEIFSLIEKYFFSYNKKENVYISKYYARCSIKKVFMIHKNAKSGHSQIIDRFLEIVGEFRFCNNEFYTFSPKDITEEVKELKINLGIQ